MAGSLNLGLKIFLGGGSGSGSCATRCASWIQAASRAAVFWLNPVTIENIAKEPS
jgi:hypothetical protein